MRRSIFKWGVGWGELCLNPITDDFRFDLVDFVVRRPMLLALYYLYMVLSGTTGCISGNLYLNLPFRALLSVGKRIILHSYSFNRKINLLSLAHLLVGTS